MLKPFKTALIATLFSLGLSTTAVADSDALTLKGSQAYGKGDYKTAAKYLQKAADQGHRDAKVILGSMYMIGQGVKQNIPKGATMLQDACNLGDAVACNQIQKIKNICAEDGRKHFCEIARYFE